MSAPRIGVNLEDSLLRSSTGFAPHHAGLDRPAPDLIRGHPASLKASLDSGSNQLEDIDLFHDRFQGLPVLAKAKGNLRLAGPWEQDHLLFE